MKDSTLWIIAAAIVGVLIVFRSNSIPNTTATNYGATTAGGVPSMLNGIPQSISAFAAGIEAAFSSAGALSNLDTPGPSEIKAVTGASLAPVTPGQASGSSPLTSSQLSFGSQPIPSASQQALMDAGSTSLPGSAAPVLTGGVVGAPPSLAFLNDNPTSAAGIFAGSLNFGGATSLDEDELFPEVGSSADILGITQSNSYSALSA